MRAAALLTLLAGCAGAAPRPEEIVAAVPPEGPRDAAAASAAERHAHEALRALRSGALETARRAAEAALENDPRAALAHAVLGRALMEEARKTTPPELNTWMRAEGELRAAQQLAPGDMAVARMAAEFFEADGHFSAAAAVLEEALATAPDDVAARREAARLRYELGEERAALTHLERLAALGVRDTETLFWTAQSRLRVAELAQREQPGEQARQAFERAAEAFRAYREAVPDDSAGYAGEAYVRFRIAELSGEPQPSDFAAMAALYAEASARNSGSPEPEFHRGVVLERAGDPAAARLAYERALGRDPEHLPALLNLAANLAAAGRGDEAARYYRRALELGPTSEERAAIEAYLRPRETTPPSAGPEARAPRGSAR